MKTVYAVSIEDDSSGQVNWYDDRASAEGVYVTAINDADLADQEINLFEVEVDPSTPGSNNEEDSITGEVDAAMWLRDYTPIRWRKGSAHSATAHELPPTD